MSDLVLVTGGSGFIAGWCVVEALQRGFAVRTTVRTVAKEAVVRETVAAAGLNPAHLQFAHADLLADEGWDAAANGCRYVLHVASPLASGATTTDRYAFVPAARDGALRVLAAARRARVERVVMTSAAAAARAPLKANRVSDESVWSDPEDRQFDAYRVSKILAERAAWDFMRSANAENTLTTILPGAVFGPVLSKETIGSVGIIQSLLQGRPPGVPRIGFWVADVRDLAKLHLDAMTAPQASGERFIAAGEFKWMGEIADILRAELGAAGSRVPRRRLPDWLVRILAQFVPQLQQVAPLIGVRFEQSSEKARATLGFAPRSARETLVDCARSLLQLGAV